MRKIFRGMVFLEFYVPFTHFHLKMSSASSIGWFFIPHWLPGCRSPRVHRVNRRSMVSHALTGLYHNHDPWTLTRPLTYDRPYELLGDLQPGNWWCIKSHPILLLLWKETLTVHKFGPTPACSALINLWHTSGILSVEIRICWTRISHCLYSPQVISSGSVQKHFFTRHEIEPIMRRNVYFE